MDSYTKEELEETLRAVLSIKSKCEKALEKLKPGTSQHTLTDRRIKAMNIASLLMARELEEK